MKLTASQLKQRVESTGSKHFQRDTMRFFGDTMKNYGVDGPYEITSSSDEKIMVYELYRRRPVKNNLQTSAYFCAETFRRVFPKR